MGEGQVDEIIGFRGGQPPNHKQSEPTNLNVIIKKT